MKETIRFIITIPFILIYVGVSIILEKLGILKVKDVE